MLDPCKNVHVEIQQLIFPDQLFIEGTSNRPYLCGNFLLLFCQMFMTLFSDSFHESCFFVWGDDSYVLLYAAASIDLVWPFCSEERDSRCFLCSVASFVFTWAFWSEESDLQCLYCAAVWFFSNRSLSSGERDSHFFLCASALVSKIFTFFSAGRDLRCFLCA